MTRTGIVATIGPVTGNADALRALHAAGMSVARLNGSHNDLDWHRHTIGLIRETLPMLPILLDIPGRKIRTTQLRVEPEFAMGDLVVLTTDLTHDGSRKVPVNYGRLHEDVVPGTRIFADDGTLSFSVLSVEGQDIVCRAETAGRLRSRKGINVPGVPLRTELVTERDKAMVAFARETGVDFIGISFVETARHVEMIRALTGGDAPRIVAKIENQSGLARLEEIVATTDVVMIDRGDLSVETSIDQVTISQKRILSVSHRLGKPVIVATEMLHTMISSPLPTKAEISDITNAVLDGAAATMLSGETAVGQFPIETVTVMRRILTAAEQHLRVDSSGPRPAEDQDIGHAVELLARSLPLTKIIVMSRTGYAARIISNRRLAQPVLAVTDSATTARSFNMLPGTQGVLIEMPFPESGTGHVMECLKALWARGLIGLDDMILAVAVEQRDQSRHLNMLQSHVVGELATAWGWSRAAA